MVSCADRPELPSPSQLAGEGNSEHEVSPLVPLSRAGTWELNLRRTYAAPRHPQYVGRRTSPLDGRLRILFRTATSGSLQAVYTQEWDMGPKLWTESILNLGTSRYQRRDWRSCRVEEPPVPADFHTLALLTRFLGPLQPPSDAVRGRDGSVVWGWQDGVVDATTTQRGTGLSGRSIEYTRPNDDGGRLLFTYREMSLQEKSQLDPVRQWVAGDISWTRCVTAEGP